MPATRFATYLGDAFRRRFPPVGSIHSNMSDTAATPHSASSGEDAGDSKTPEVRVCEAFSSPSGNVIFKSSDDVIFRVEDYYLKATRLVLSRPLIMM